MADICGDNRFEIIKKAKAELLNSTNIETSEDEMKVLDNFLFRCWQMDWLERYEKPRDPLDIPTMTTDFVKEHGLPCPNGYIFKDENGNVINAQKIVLEKKKREYPKTYEECAGRIMRVELWNTLWGEDATEYEEQTEDLIEAFIRLKVCRDAYWKIAGEEMGLGKPWVPDWGDDGIKYTIEYYNEEIIKDLSLLENRILVFPTVEMRDAFYENFKKEMEQCKELL